MKKIYISYGTCHQGYYRAAGGIIKGGFGSGIFWTDLDNFSYSLKFLGSIIQFKEDNEISPFKI